MHTINAVKRITQHLMLGDFAEVRRCCRRADIPENVAAWGLATINDTLTPQQKQSVNEAVMAGHNGWKAYYEGDYVNSLQFFINALNGNSGERIGLGLAKVYTRLGHWDTAKQWLLHELPHARQHNELFTQAECYGALGEVFLRANHNKPAYECFGNAFHVLPKGSSQREKQYNYQASALMRTGNEGLAEQCLMSALYLAADKQTDSVWHSLARLQFLWLQQNKPDPVSEHYPGHLRQKPPTGIAEGFLMMGLAFLANRQARRQEAVGWAEKACACFNTQYPTEAYWAKKLLCVLEGGRPTTALDRVIPTIDPIGPLTLPDSLIEAAWYGIELPNQGFAPLGQAQDIATLWEARRLFFI
ncbi:MAG: hypothetical protein PHU14_08365 [Methylovulum sp.]|nr:hypothetical protein [Methylovulum sp.]